MKASFVPRRLIVNKIKARSAHAGGLSPDLQFWLQAEQGLRETDA
jgi:hypothetical protein